MSARLRLITLWAPVLAYMAVLFGLSSIAQTPTLPDGMDKDVHALLYAGLGAVTMRALAGGWRARFTVRHAILAVLIATAYGVTDEWHQSFVPPRQSDVHDVVADSVGAAVAAAGLCVVSAMTRRGERRGV